MAQPREATDDLGQHQRRAIAILDIGSMDHGMDQIAIGVGQDVALASLDLLPRVIAARPAASRGLHTLAVRSEEHTSELQSLMRISYAVFCLKKKIKHKQHNLYTTTNTNTR